MIKKLFFISLCSLCFSINGYAQSFFTTSPYANFPLGVGANNILGWGENFNRTIDVRPNPNTTYGTMMINYHTGLTFSAHSYYGGIRFYNQGYPYPYDASTGAVMVMSITNNYVGINTTNPLSALQIGDFGKGSPNNQISIPGTYNFEQVRLGQLGHGSSALEFVNHADATNSYGIKFLVNVDSAPGLQLQYAPTTSSYSSLNYTTGLYMDVSGNIAIGTINNAGYKLAVNGKAIATSMTVKLNANWPDYVFKPEYYLPSLTEVKAYIDQNQHLPDMPSAQEVEKNGQNLGEMNKILTKKVEELTLYLIEKDKKQKEQENMLKQQDQDIQQLKEQINYLIKALKHN